MLGMNIWKKIKHIFKDKPLNVALSENLLNHNFDFLDRVVFIPAGGDDNEVVQKLKNTDLFDFLTTAKNNEGNQAIKTCTIRALVRNYGDTGFTDLGNGYSDMPLKDENILKYIEVVSQHFDILFVAKLSIVPIKVPELVDDRPYAKILFCASLTDLVYTDVLNLFKESITHDIYNDGVSRTGIYKVEYNYELYIKAFDAKTLSELKTIPPVEVKLLTLEEGSNSLGKELFPQRYVEQLSFEEYKKACAHRVDCHDYYTRKDLYYWIPGRGYVFKQEK